MLKKFNNFVNLSIATTVFCAITGVVLIAFPEVSLKVISYVLAGILILGGVISLIKYNGTFAVVDFLSIGVLMIILGLIILLNPNILTIIVPIIIGIWVVFNSVFKLKISFILKDCKYNNWVLALSLALLSMLCGIVLIVNPEIGAITFTTFIGILLIVYSLSDMVDLIIFKKNVNMIAEVLK